MVKQADEVSFLILPPAETRRILNGPSGRVMSRYSDMVNQIVAGNGVFVPAMTRSQLETVRQMVGRLDGRVLRSRAAFIDGINGRVLTLEGG